MRRRQAVTGRMKSAGESLPGKLLYSESAIGGAVRKLAEEISARLIDAAPTFLILLKGAARFGGRSKGK